MNTDQKAKAEMSDNPIHKQIVMSPYKLTANHVKYTNHSKGRRSPELFNHGWTPMNTDAPNPVPLPIGWGEGGRRPGEGFCIRVNLCPSVVDFLLHELGRY